jgi:hypothetical protein
LTGFHKAVTSLRIASPQAAWERRVLQNGPWILVLSSTLPSGLKRSKLTLKLSFPAKTLCLFGLKLPGTREQMNFASLTPGQLHKESKTMTQRPNLFNLFNPLNPFTSKDELSFRYL